MAFKRYNIKLIIHLLLLAAFSAGGAVYLAEKGFDIYFLLIAALAIILVFNLIRLFNRSNEELSFFLSSVLNEDSSLVFSEKTGNKSYDSLHRSINRLNDQIRDARMKVIVQEKFYQAVVENSSSGLIAFNDRGIIRLANTKARELMGINHLHNIKQLQRVNRRLIDAMQNIKPGNKQSLNIIIDDINVHLSLTAAEIRLKNEEVKVIGINDISHEIDKQEIESWQKLIRILNHEIMNSVAPITSLSSTISGYYKEDGIKKEPGKIDEKTISNTLKGLSIIEEHGKGLINFVDSYRSLTKMPEIKPVELPVKDIFESIIILAASLKEEKYPGLNLSLNNTVEPEDLVICADENLLTRVLFNLVKNSIEAIEDTPDPSVELHAEQSRDGKVIIKVSDNGHGIDEDLVE
ncbi:MAG: ATP-binding protein, partial [Bacteroidales bacterium]|nr:ATP-binding protein [Bacteroidales bacterium]